MCDACNQSQPEVRATVTRNGELVMTPWSAGAARDGGPAAAQIRLRKLVGVFDLTIERAHADGITHATDLIVSDVFVTDRVELGHRKLVEFAAHLGYKRVWFGNEVVALESALLGGTWQSTCRHCGLTWSDSTDGFWLNTRGMGYFPPVCSLCSHPIAQAVGEREPAKRSQSGEPGPELEMVPVQPGGRAADCPLPQTTSSGFVAADDPERYEAPTITND